MSKSSKPTQKKEYLPQTFETMMEAFGINLQRKTLYEEFHSAHKDIEVMMRSKNKNVSNADIINLVG